MKLTGLLLLLALAAAPAAWAAPGVMIRDESLRSAPSATAAGVGTVARGARVEILGRQGGWTQVRANGRTGWVRLLSVRGGEAARADVAGEIGGVVALGTTPRDPGRVVAVAGVRGLTEDELRKARFDEAQLRQLEAHAVGRDEAARFAADAGLARRDVAHLPAPRRQEGTSPWGGN